MALYKLTAQVTVTVETEVEANSEEEAIKKGEERFVEAKVEGSSIVPDESEEWVANLDEEVVSIEDIEVENKK